VEKDGESLEGVECESRKNALRRFTKIYEVFAREIKQLLEHETRVVEYPDHKRICPIQEEGEFKNNNHFSPGQPKLIEDSKQPVKGLTLRWEGIVVKAGATFSKGFLQIVIWGGNTAG